ncbi:MAG: o-succinylbenzoate--CoA ligase [Chloroflexi bacterium]|nr:o-succinylbenzoate--CoA ligase [Chloroflexota bacterium]MCI0855201.1 o-succinylbenzoate--CoA ligase [Chloroflexota bacterium]
MPEWLWQRARLSPERTALVCEDDRWTFAELDRRVASVAGRLAKRGVSPGDHVALLAANGSGFVQLVHAVPRLRAVLIPLNVRLTVDELAWQLADSAATCLVYDDGSSARAVELSRRLPSVTCLHLAELTRPQEDTEAGQAVEPGRIDLSAVHSVIYTSGTSGRPKGAMLTHGNHFWSAAGSAQNLGLRDDDCWLACMPLFHIGGLAILLRSVIYGNTVVVHETFDPGAVNRAIDDQRVTIFSAVSNMLGRILESRGERPFPPTLRCVLAGGGPVPQPLLDECRRRGLPVVQTYGLTEAASQVATQSLDTDKQEPGSAGRPLANSELRIERELGEVLPSGESGEIVVRGPTVMSGYLGDPDATAEVLRDGWLHTGDIGYIDADGNLHVLDRRDDLIVSGGENVYPAEVEEVLRSHTGILDAAVFGVPDERWGQRVIAAIVLRAEEQPTEEELAAFCGTRLASYKVPKEFRFVPQLPRSPSGKLLRRSLREEWLDATREG